MASPSFNRNPLYRQVADFLREELARDRRPGERLESEERLAERFSVSLITIREALRLLAGEGVIERRHGKGTFVAERDRERDQDRWSAVLIERDIAHPHASFFHMRVAQEVRRILEEQDRPVKLYIGRLRPGEKQDGLTCREFLTDLSEDRISGVVAIDVLQEPSWIDQMRRLRLPLVATNGAQYGHILKLDRERLVREGVESLVEGGRRKLAMIGWDEEEITSSLQIPSYRVLFRKALEEHGLPVDESRIRTDLHPAYPGGGWEQFRELWAVRSGRPDGLLVCDDLLFRDAATAILDLGVKVPGELMVASHANRNSGIFCPFPVEKFEVDPDQTARALVEILLKAKSGDGPDSSHRFLPMSRVPASPVVKLREQNDE